MFAFHFTGTSTTMLSGFCLWTLQAAKRPQEQGATIESQSHVLLAPESTPNNPEFYSLKASFTKNPVEFDGAGNSFTGNV